MILILGGTGEARKLGARCAEAGVKAMLSLAGVTASPASQHVPTRRGGFGGAAEFRSFLRDHDVTAVVDATHPFARAMTLRSHQICAEMALPMLRLERPAWQAQKGEDWVSISDPAELRQHITPADRLFLATGPAKAVRYGLEGYNVICRRIDDADGPPPEGWRWHVARPPFSIAQEMALFQRERITHLVCKNSGGPAREKLDAARASQIKVLMIERAPLPNGLACVEDVNEAFDWMKNYANY